MKEPLVIVIKSYHNDVNRVYRLIKSIESFNVDDIPVYICIPENDRQLFKTKVGEKNICYISDESILELTLKVTKTKELKQSGGILQQIVKSEVWRLNICENYLLIDSDSYFIKPFHRHDFIWKESFPYTIMNEGRHQRDWAARSHNEKYLKQYDELRQKATKLFNRKGPLFDFAPTPCIWSCKVWQALYEKVAASQQMSFFDQILQFPCETQWYGEFLLFDQTIPIIPREPLFKVWGYSDQYNEGMSLGETDEVLAKNYLGVVEQSNWSKTLDAMSSEEKKRLKWRKRWNRWKRMLPRI